MKPPTMLHRMLLLLDQRAASAGRPTPAFVRRAAQRNAELSRHLSRQRALDALLTDAGRSQREQLTARAEPMRLRLPEPRTSPSPTLHDRWQSTLWKWLGPTLATAIAGVAAIGWWSQGTSVPTTATSDPTPDVSLLIDQVRDTGQAWSAQWQTFEARWTPTTPTRAPGEVLSFAAAAGEEPIRQEWTALRVVWGRTFDKLAEAVPVALVEDDTMSGAS